MTSLRYAYLSSTAGEGSRERWCEHRRSGAAARRRCAPAALRGSLTVREARDVRSRRRRRRFHVPAGPTRRGAGHRFAGAADGQDARGRAGVPRHPGSDARGDAHRDQGGPARRSPSAITCWPRLAKRPSASCAPPSIAPVASSRSTRWSGQPRPAPTRSRGSAEQDALTSATKPRSTPKTLLTRVQERLEQALSNVRAGLRELETGDVAPR